MIGYVIDNAENMECMFNALYSPQALSTQLMKTFGSAVIELSCEERPAAHSPCPQSVSKEKKN